MPARHALRADPSTSRRKPCAWTPTSSWWGPASLTPQAPVPYERVEAEVVARDREMDNPFTEDLQIAALRRFSGRVAGRAPAAAVG